MRADWVLDTTIFEAHSGYLEVLLGGGVVPLLLLAAALFIGARHVVMNVFSSPNQAAVWPLALIAFTLTANLQESFLVGHHFLLLLLFVGLLSGIHHGQGGRE
jgi:O-antigen ligase